MCPSNVRTQLPSDTFQIFNVLPEQAVITWVVGWPGKAQMQLMVLVCPFRVWTRVEFKEGETSTDQILPSPTSPLLATNKEEEERKRGHKAFTVYIERAFQEPTKIAASQKRRRG